MDHYAVVFFPKVNLEELQDFRKKYDPNWDVLTPHITLVFPFDGIPENDIISHLSNIAEQTQSFTVNLEGFTKSFDDYLFLLVDKNKDEVFKLHDALYTGVFLPELRNDIPFIPHMTLGLFKTNDGQFDQIIYEQAFEEAKNLDINMDCSFNEFSLIQGDGIAPSKIIQNFNFK